MAVPARRQRALLSRLALAPGRVVPAAELIAAVWEDRATHALQVHVWRLRALLGPAAGALVTRAPGYVLDVPPEAVDAERFERGVRRAAEAEPAAAVELLGRALGLWRGPAYAGSPTGSPARPRSGWSSCAPVRLRQEEGAGVRVLGVLVDLQDPATACCSATRGRTGGGYRRARRAGGRPADRRRARGRARDPRPG
ncbi:MAG: winged helix-turn-helix domain-containing protein [Micromonosporaceae bacterium]